jgi:hypothetical protein
MLINEPSLKIALAFLVPETRKALSLPVAALIVGALPQVETIMELTNRVCDRYFTALSTTTDAARGQNTVTGCPAV